MRRLEGKVGVITGGSSGIGFATAKAFLAEGATRVYITGRRKAELDAAVNSLGARAAGVQGDVTNPNDLDRLYDLNVVAFLASDVSSFVSGSEVFIDGGMAQV